MRSYISQFLLTDFKNKLIDNNVYVITSLQLNIILFIKVRLEFYNCSRDLVKQYSENQRT